MERHVGLLATLSMVYGIAGGVASLLALILFGGFGPLWDWAEASGGWGLIATGAVLIHLLLAVPLTVAGIGLVRFHEWARLFSIFLCAVGLLNIPLGSALSIYGLWVLLTPETDPLFRDPVLRRNRSMRN